MLRKDRAKKFFLPTMIAVLLLGLFAAPVTAGKKKKKKEKKPAVERITFQILKPMIELGEVEGYDSTQSIGGVRIELTRVPTTLSPMYLSGVKPRESKMEAWTGIRAGGQPSWVIVAPFYKIDPENLQFNIRITNHTGRVLRLTGVPLLFTKDGETIDTAYEQNDLEKTMILPEKSWEGLLQGPSLEQFGLKTWDVKGPSQMLEVEAVASEGVIMVGLYDVITEFDAAGTPTARSNFEWAFSYTATAVPEEAEVIRWKAKLSDEQIRQYTGEFPADEVLAAIPTN